VGDAAYFRDPITAHGITDALRDAELLAGAIVSGTGRAPAGYAAARDSVARGMLETSDAIASFAWDLEQIKILHLELNRGMNAGIRLQSELQSRADCEATSRACPLAWTPKPAPKPAAPSAQAMLDTRPRI
jgi:2-polyprenyl-6-methoxyphenol hydroxylase-like FAD-dependent oxidoreductase